MNTIGCVCKQSLSHTHIHARARTRARTHVSSRDAGQQHQQPQQPQQADKSKIINESGCSQPAHVELLSKRSGWDDTIRHDNTGHDTTLTDTCTKKPEKDILKHQESAISRTVSSPTAVLPLAAVSEVRNTLSILTEKKNASSENKRDFYTPNKYSSLILRAHKENMRELREFRKICEKASAAEAR